MKQRKLLIRFKQYPVIIGILWLLISSLSFANDPRIIGGKVAKAGAWPFAVFFMHHGDNQCGGSLIAPDWVLTAAHCVDSENNDPNEVVLGLIDLTTEEGERIGVDKIFVHPAYIPNDNSNLDNDIALIHLNEPSKQKPVSVITPAGMSNVESSNTVLTVIGWGLLSTTPIPPDFELNTSDILQQVNVEFISRTVCNGTDWYNGDITPNEFCAGFESGGKDSCGGDSGGPILVNDSGTIKQAGIVSWGQGCAEKKKPGVYTRIANYTDWIADNMGSTSTPDNDKDNDGIADVEDNCTDVANSDQLDDDNDNFGNSCDGDLNNDGKTSFLDVHLFVAAYQTEQGDADYRADADFNSDAKVDIEDFRILVKLFNAPPGPSGLVE